MAAVSFRVLMSVALVLAIVSRNVEAQSAAAPAPSPTSDGTSIDQGIAYILMLVALGVFRNASPTGVGAPNGEAMPNMYEQGANAYEE